MAVMETIQGVVCITHDITIIVMGVATVALIVILAFADATKGHLLFTGRVGILGMIMLQRNKLIQTVSSNMIRSFPVQAIKHVKKSI